MKYFGSDVLELVNGGTGANNDYYASILLNSPYLNLPQGELIDTMDKLNVLFVPGTYKVLIQNNNETPLNPLLIAARGYRQEDMYSQEDSMSIGGSVIVYNTNNSNTELFSLVHQIIIGEINGEYGIHYRSMFALQRNSFAGIDFVNTTKSASTTEIENVINSIIPIDDNGKVIDAVNAEAAETATYATNATQAETLSKTLQIEKGGTGAITAEEACENIGALPNTGGKLSGPLIIGNIKISYDEEFKTLDFEAVV